MRHPVVIRADAEADLAEAFAWYEERRPGLGEGLLRAVDERLVAIRANPFRFPVVELNVRRALVPRFPYGIFYTLEGEAVIVLAVFHASRHPHRWRDRT